ncbi:lysine N(6)-hydroxylase/L-ornithine N(5)-oxygenase family protein [Rhodococcus sp. SGAir0479]|uniref:lysine N(6)-hydroxylase/L-ornithine N(5)-oxygenase family protein n=1 Tax=Rhodococcus sp. SGAir0479 TaxID=2567884 RepID=UPI0010CCF9FD|nr:SidA/IucD/PvdA family monooxygenase [Rhodococcus sp. SGAir0479]QCQ93712.1 L-lysine 6-monooxygenase [Rhodococcus sp. SGAir0479]
MTDSRRADDEQILDLVGIGFGPSNLALAIAIEEHNAECSPTEKVTARFFEKQEEFGWHRGMLLDGATMQIAFPKDLVTFRNPRSGYSFFSYLHERGRLVDFVNHQTFFPTRVEFQDYLRWAAARVDADVRYGTTVASVEGVEGGEAVELFEVVLADGTTVRARNVVVGAGLRERLPEWATPSARCFHNHQFLFRIAEMPQPVHQRFVVLGAGQSAAEVVHYLHGRYPEAEVHSVFSRFGFSPADDSPYANRIFDPGTVDELHAAPAVERARLLALHRGTNYSVVDIELINELYATEYQERVRGQRRLFMRRASEIRATSETPDGIEVHVHSALDGLTDTLMCDALVLATGFEPTPIGAVFGASVPGVSIERGVGRDYRLALDPDVRAGVYLQGGTEKTHGLTASLLSNVAIRAGEILNSILAHRDIRGGLARLNEDNPYATSEVR